MEDQEQRDTVGLGEVQSQLQAASREPALSETLPLAPGDEPPPGEWLGTSTSTLSAIERLKATIDEETQKLEARIALDFDAFSRRKNRGLLELTRAVRLAPGGGLDPRLVPELGRLRASLVKNQAALQIHLDAVREVSAIITKSIEEVESDGTYSQAGSRLCK